MKDSYDTEMKNLREKLNILLLNCLFLQPQLRLSDFSLSEYTRTPYKAKLAHLLWIVIMPDGLFKKRISDKSSCSVRHIRVYI